MQEEPLVNPKRGQMCLARFSKDMTFYRAYIMQYHEASKGIHREYVYSVAVYQKYLTRLGEFIIFEPWRENYHFSQLSYTSDLLSLIISETNKQDFRSIWNWSRCCNDIMNNVNCVMKRDIYLQKMHSYSKNIHGISNEIYHNRQFLLFPQCFLLVWRTFCQISIKFKVVLCKLFQF